MPQVKHRILIIDDDEFLRDVYLRVFQNAGFEVFAAEDGAEGLAVATKEHPEIIFTGIMMPNMSGFELMKQLKSRPDASAIPVVISSHLGREEDRKEAGKLGAKAFVIKGLISPKEVVNLISDILEKQIFKVVVDQEKLDGKILSQKLKTQGPMIFELTPEIAQGEKIFRDLESNIRKGLP